jgi:hypothetical protein
MNYLECSQALLDDSVTLRELFTITDILDNLQNRMTLN